VRNPLGIHLHSVELLINLWEDYAEKTEAYRLDYTYHGKKTMFKFTIKFREEGIIVGKGVLF
jgi:hypothetical protein